MCVQEIALTIKIRIIYVFYNRFLEVTSVTFFPRQKITYRLNYVIFN